MSTYRIEAKHFGSHKARVLPKDYDSQLEADDVAGTLTEFYDGTINFAVYQVKPLEGATHVGNREQRITEQVLDLHENGYSVHGIAAVVGITENVARGVLKRNHLRPHANAKPD